MLTQYTSDIYVFIGSQLNALCINGTFRVMQVLWCAITLFAYCIYTVSSKAIIFQTG